MFKPNTLFVLGAASSESFGFPLGGALKGMIADRLRYTTDDFGHARYPSAETATLFRALAQDTTNSLSEGDVRRVAGIITRGVGLASSIDNFLEMRKTEPGLAICAKAAIASIIFEKEQKCASLKTENIKRNRSVSFDGLWHQQFAQICFEDVTIQNLPEALSRVSAVSFNYDRSFEQFVRIAIAQLYSLEWNEATEFANNLIVTHPYGSLAQLPGSNSRFELEFGQDGEPHILGLAQQIKTFTEQVTEEKTLETILKQVQSADTIIFLGFGYHKQNVTLLDPNQTHIEKQVYGTAIGIANTARDVLKGRLEVVFGKKPEGKTSVTARVKLENLNCNQLLEEYRIALQDK